MICIRPIAPFGETARTFPPLSARMTARIHDAEMPNRCEASATYSQKGSTPRSTDTELLCAHAGEVSGVVVRTPIIAMMMVAAAVVRLTRNRMPIGREWTAVLLAA